jgi:hypothetical protein
MVLLLENLLWLLDLGRAILLPLCRMLVLLRP